MKRCLIRKVLAWAVAAVFLAGGVVSPAGAGCWDNSPGSHNLESTGAGPLPGHAHASAFEQSDQAGLHHHPRHHAGMVSLDPAADHGDDGDGGHCCALHISCCTSAVLAPTGVWDIGIRARPEQRLPLDERFAGRTTAPLLPPPRAAA